jgi:SCY1-like protein 2
MHSKVLNVEQFQRFMVVIRKLGDRVEQEHNQFLRDSQRLEDRSATRTNGGVGNQSFAGTVDFESLVGTNGAAGKKEVSSSSGGWDDEVWGSILSNGDGVRTSFGSVLWYALTDISIQAPVQTLTLFSATAASQSQISSLSASPKSIPQDDLRSSTTRTLSSRAHSVSTVAANTGTYSSPLQLQASTSGATLAQQLKPNLTGGLPRAVAAAPLSHGQPQRPDYNISLSSISSQISPLPHPNKHTQNLSQLPTPQHFATPTTPLAAAPPAMGALLTPSRPAQPPWPGSSAPKQLTKDDWGDFDPLS